MSKKAATKETLHEENIDAPVRRSTRNSINPTSSNSAAPKSIGISRTSSDSINEKKKPQITDTSPKESAGRRTMRRTSTEEDIKATPIKTRRSSISKIIEEDKKVSSPISPSRKVGTRAASTSPTITTGVSARRTRRSISASQENEVVEQIPLRRSTRRRSSVDTQEDVSNEEVLTKSKPTPRRRRSNSVDEKEETTKNDNKSKTKRLYSEDNQLDPIEEHETELTEKSEGKTDETTVVKIEKDHHLSVIEESEDTVEKDTNKIIKDIDNMLKSGNYSPKPKTVTEKIKARSIFSPVTPKTILSEKKTDVDCEIIISDPDIGNESPKSHQKEKNEIISKSDSLKNTSPLKKQSKEESDEETGETPTSSEKLNENDSSKNNLITNGSDDSYTFNLSKIQSSNNETDDDVFTSPGSNKENNCISVPPKKNENRVVLKEKKSSDLSDLDIKVDVFSSKTSKLIGDVSMEVDCEVENVKDCNKIHIADCSDKESKMLSFNKTEQYNMKEQGQEDSTMSVQKLTSSGDTERITNTKNISGNVTSEDETSKLSSGRISGNVEINKNEVKSNTQLEDSRNDASCSSTKSNSEVENSFNSLNSNDDNKIDSSFSVFKSPKIDSKQKDSLPSSPGKCADKIINRRESKDSDVSSHFSIQLIDSDEEDEDNKERLSVVERNSNTSKEPQNKPLRESETEEGIEEVNKDSAAKECGKLCPEILLADFPKEKRKSHQPILGENSSPSNENAIENSPPLLKQKVNSRKSESKLSEFEKSNQNRKSPRQSLHNNSQDDGDEEILNVKGVECEEDSLKIITSPSNNQGKKQCAEKYNIEESITKRESNSSLKINIIKEIKVYKNIVTEWRNAGDSDLVEKNSYIEGKKVEDELLNCEQKHHFLNESSVGDEAESDERHEKSKLNDSETKSKNKNKLEVDEINACEEIENSEDANRKGENVVDVTKDNTKTSPTNEEVEIQKEKQPNSDVKSEKYKSTITKGDRNSKVSSVVKSKRSCDFSASESDVKTDSSRQKSNRVTKIENESSDIATSPLKSKIEKMSACGVNFVNPSPTASKMKLDEKTSKKLDQYLNEKFSAMQNEEQDSTSDEYESVNNTNQFLDNMAEEGEEDTPSEGSNDIVDEGESLNSKDSEIDPDDTYDSNDSFIVKDGGDDLDLLPGDEYDLEDAPESTKTASKKRRRIVRNLNTSSEEESSAVSRVSFSNKVEVIPEKKSPIKQISPIKITDKACKNENDLHTDLQDAQHQESPKEKPHVEISSIFVDMVNDSYEDKRTPSKQNETHTFDETIRSLIEDERSSSIPNASFNETSNTSKQNNSLRSSSIIIHESVNINEIKAGLLADKLQQVVSVFCAGIRSSDGNISMNVSLDYTENPSEECDNKKVNDVEQALKTPTGEKAEAKSTHSTSKSVDNNDSINRENSRKRKLCNISPKKIQSERSQNDDFIEGIPVEDLSVLNASFNDESSIQYDSSRIIDSVSAKKKRRSSNRKEKQLCNENVVISDICENDKEAAKMEGEENEFEESTQKTDEIQVRTSKKRRRPSNKMKKPLNESLEKSSGKEEFTENKDEDNSNQEQTEHKNFKSSSIDDKQESKHSDYEQRTNIVKDITDKESEPVKKKKPKKRKCVEKNSTEVLPEIVTSKRKKLVDMVCEEFPANDLRFKLPSFKEMSEEPKVALKTKKLKKLQSDLKRDLKSTLLSGLVTDVKNRPRRMLKPSVEMDTEGWLIEGAASKPSSANLSKHSFNFNQIDAKDFKNQVLYDPRIKREPALAFLRKKGHY